MEPSADDEPSRPPSPPPKTGDGLLAVPPNVEPRQLDEATAAARDEVRRLVDAGATSPEDLRALAEKMRAQREREDELWRADVRPSLMKSKKRRFAPSDLKPARDDDRSAERRFLAVAGVSVVVVLLVLTLSGAPLVVILLLLLGHLAYAFVTGRRPAEPEELPDELPDEPAP